MDNAIQTFSMVLSLYGTVYEWPYTMLYKYGKFPNMLLVSYILGMFLLR